MPLPVTDSADTTTARTALAAIRRELNTHFLERQWEIDLELIAAITGRHVALIGGRGQGKSAITRALFSRFTDANVFHLLLNDTTQPEEIHGPLNLRKFRDHSVLEYNTAGYLPWAHFAFLDEGFKGNSASLNLMLTMLEERLFEWTDDNDVRRMQSIPLIAAVLASNEMPQKENLAFADRIVGWRLVQSLSRGALTVLRQRDAANRARLLAGECVSPIGTGTMLTLAQLAALRPLVHQVTIPESVTTAWEDILTDLDQAGLLDLTPRRDLQVQDLLRGYVVLQHRADLTARLSDLIITTHALWSDPDPKTMRRITQIVLKHAHELLGQAQDAYDSVAAEVAAIMVKTSGIKPNQRAALILASGEKVEAHITEMERILRKARADQLETSEIEALLNQARMQRRALVAEQSTIDWRH